jgi:hypothetical protein
MWKIRAEVRFRSQVNDASYFGNFNENSYSLNFLWTEFYPNPKIQKIRAEFHSRPYVEYGFHHTHFNETRSLLNGIMWENPISNFTQISQYIWKARIEI